MNEIIIETRLDKYFLKRDDLKEFLGKQVTIVLRKLDSKTAHRKKLIDSMGRWQLGKELDDVNIRDLAYD